jgi:hypothetical protein
MINTQFIVSRDDLNTTRIIETPLPAHDALADGSLLVAVDRFAFTANNITYAVLGDKLKYWRLFPAPDGFGIVPVWGFGDVIASRHPGIAEGERLFGYFPMATHLVIAADGVNQRGLRDAAVHRQDVAPVYNAYARVGRDPAFAGRHGDHQALLRPLFMLSFLVDDFLAENKFFGARSVVLSSASSKTAFGLAHLLQTQRKPIRVIGLTSLANAPFVTSLRCYDDVVTYDGIEALASDQPAVFIDMAGNGELRARLHRHLGDRLTYSGRIGLTHHDASHDDADLPGVKPQWFFAPDQIRKRAREWGPGGIEQRFGAEWSGFAPHLDGWIGITENRGPGAVERVYRDTLAGRVAPNEGHMLSLHSTGHTTEV